MKKFKSNFMNLVSTTTLLMKNCGVQYHYAIHKTCLEN